VARRTACMEDDEWAEWATLNERLEPARARAESPCEDCNASFAAEMTAIGRCDGALPRNLIPPTEAQERRRAQWRAYNAKRLTVIA